MKERMEHTEKRSKKVQKAGAVLVLTLAFFSLLLLSGCTRYSDGRSVWVNDVCYYISDSGKEAFASEFRLDLSAEHPEVRVEEAIEGVPVVALGGFFGVGVPSPFQPEQKSLPRFSSWEPSLSEFGLPYTKQDVPVTVYLPKTLQQVVNAAGNLGESPFYGDRDEDGVIRFLRPVYEYICDPENPELYSEDGNLFGRDEDGKPVQLSVDVSPASLTAEEKLAGRYVLDHGDGRKDVFEFFPAFQVIFVRIDSYTNGTANASASWELRPTETDASVQNRADVIEGEWLVLSASDNSRYSGPAYPYFRLEAGEEKAVLTPVTETGEEIADGRLELFRDNAAPSAFPNDPAVLERGLSDEPTFHLPTAADRLPDCLFNNADGQMRIFRDGTIVLRRFDRETPQVYRGVCGVDPDRAILFSVTPLSVMQKPLEGKVSMEFTEEGILLKPMDGEGSRPLIAEGEESAEWNY